MSELENQALRQARLQAAVKSTSKQARHTHELLITGSADISKEKTQYFEKIALGSGATIAALVSFVGAHSGRLHPPYLLRSALIVFVLAMISAMARNWIYPFYVGHFLNSQDLFAALELEEAKTELFTAFPTPSLQDGTIIDGKKWVEQHLNIRKTFEGKIEGSKKSSERAWSWTVRAEVCALVCAVVGMGLLVALAWINF